MVGVEWLGESSWVGVDRLGWSCRGGVDGDE